MEQCARGLSCNGLRFIVAFHINNDKVAFGNVGDCNGSHHRGEWYDYDGGHHMMTSTDGDADIRQVLLTRALEGRDYVDVSK